MAVKIRLRKISDTSKKRYNFLKDEHDEHPKKVPSVGRHK